MASLLSPRFRLLAAASATGALLLAATGAAGAEQQHQRQLDWSSLATVGNGPAEHSAGSQIRKHFGAPQARIDALPDAGVPGIDVSNHQGGVNWSGVADDGVRFAYVKATEGHSYTSPGFAHQYTGSFEANLIRGAYHFAIPNDGTTAKQQADFFLRHGGAWSSDGRTLPPLLDLEYNPYGESCYGLDQQDMRGWIGDFSARVHARTGRFPAIYTNLDWWRTCTGNWAGLSATNPLFVARYGRADPGELPGDWRHWTFWQYANAGRFPGDQDYFNGDAAELSSFARNPA